MTQEDLNNLMWNSLPQWQKDQITHEREHAEKPDGDDLLSPPLEEFE